MNSDAYLYGKDEQNGLHMLVFFMGFTFGWTLLLLDTFVSLFNLGFLSYGSLLLFL